jgi:hypothetical protein
MLIEKKQHGCMWWFTPIIPMLGRLRQEDSELEVSLDYLARSCLRKTTSRMLVAHACNPSYVGGWDQEDYNLKEPKQIVHETLSPK